MTDPTLQVTWTDAVTGTRGYVVIDRLVRGLASGGLRVREGCTLDEVAGLARGMSRKEALVYDPADRYLPLGGAKGGLDIDPGSPEMESVLTRFLGAIRPIVREQWTTGEDLGVRQDTLDTIASRLGMASTVEAIFATMDDPASARARLRDAFAVEVDGVALADLVGGYGVAEAAVALAEQRGHDAEQMTAVVQGFGSIGGAAARYLQRAGVRVVAVADRDGLICDGAGLDIEHLLAARDSSGCIDRRRSGTGSTDAARGAWLDVDADILVPAATSYAIDRAAAARVRGSMIVEGANMPTLPDAEVALAARGIPVLPDFLANWATNAWWWWVVFGDIEPTAEASFTKITRTMRRLVTAVADGAQRDGVSLRTAALAVADGNAQLLAERFGGGAP